MLSAAFSYYYAECHYAECRDSWCHGAKLACIGFNQNVSIGFQVLHSRVGLGLSRKHKTRLKRLAKDKNSSLLGTLMNYACKFFTLGPRLVLQKRIHL